MPHYYMGVGIKNFQKRNGAEILGQSCHLLKLTRQMNNTEAFQVKRKEDLLWK